MKKISKVSSPALTQTVTVLSPKNAYFRDIELATRYNVSRVTIWRWVKDGTFPSPVKLSPGCTRWKGDSVDNWESDQAA